MATLNDINRLINEAITKAIEPLTTKVDAIDSVIQSSVQASMKKYMEDLHNKVEELENKVDALEQENNHLREQLIETTNFSTKTSTIAAIKDIDREVHSRKWNIIISGLPGKQGETEYETEQKVRQMAVQELKINDAEDPCKHPFAACHRQKQCDDAAIIVKFANLTNKSKWITGAKELKHSTKNIGISQDLPPVLKTLKDQVLGARSKLKEEKSKSKIVYSKTWPYLTLKYPDGSHFKPTYTIDDLLREYYKHPTVEVPLSFYSMISCYLPPVYICFLLQSSQYYV
jgi:regulator of replication initiation timing